MPRSGRILPRSPALPVHHTAQAEDSRARRVADGVSDWPERLRNPLVISGLCPPLDSSDVKPEAPACPVAQVVLQGIADCGEGQLIPRDVRLFEQAGLQG